MVIIINLSFLKILSVTINDNFFNGKQVRAARMARVATRITRIIRALRLMSHMKRIVEKKPGDNCNSL